MFSYEPTLHKSTFEYLKPNEDQLKRMSLLREESKKYANILETSLPNGPDKTYIIRKFRELTMWNNVCLTREADGTPRL